MNEKKPKKIVWEERFKCPHCKESVLIKKTRTTLEPAVPAEVEEKLIVEKDMQTTLK